MSELGKRVAVAAVGIPTVIGLLYLGGWYLAVPIAGFAVLGSMELYRLSAENGVEPVRWLGAAAAGGLVLLAAWRPTFAGFAPWALTLLAGSTALALGAAIFARGPERTPLSVAAVTVFGAIYTGLSLAAVPLLHELPRARSWASSADDPWAGVLIIALPLAATWLGDTCAFFAGKAWGKAKMAPTISPNKSWVGFWAALAGAAMAGVIWYLVAEPRLAGLPFNLLLAAGIGALLGLGGVLGDLAESLLKREAGVKDSGTFFPGHGGVLDRLDALLATLPLAFVVLALMDGRP